MTKEIDDFNKAFEALMALIPIKEEVAVERIKYGEHFQDKTKPTEPMSPNYYRTLCDDMKCSIVGMAEARLPR